LLKRPYKEEEEDYYIDWQTTNTSFLKVALLLKNAGVENYDFCLKLYDQDLVDVDPYDEDLSPEDMGKIAIEIHNNYYYFLREIARIPEEGSSTEIGGGSPFILHRGNLAQVWCFEHNISHYLELPRQFGKTTGAVQRYLWQFSYGSTASTTIFMNMDKAAAVGNLTRLKDSRSLLPEFLQQIFSLDEKTGSLKKDTDNVNEIKNKTLKNTIVTKASARSVQNAERVGRGLTVPSLWFDEFGHMAFNETIHAAAVPAFIKASENAAKNEKPFAVCVTSTPGDLATTHGKYAYDLKERAGKFTENLYDFDADDVHTWMDKNSSNKMIYISYSFLQLGKTMEWFEDQCKQLNHNWMKIRRELLLQWNKASDNSPFLPEDIDELVSMSRLPIETLRINKYYDVWLYKKLDPMKKYLVGADVSKGVGRDSTAVAIVDSDTLEIVGLFLNNTIRSKEFKRFLTTLILDHIPNSVLIIENNFTGDAIIEDLKYTALKHHLYYDFVTRLAENKLKDGVVQKRNKNRVIYGHEVTSATRPKMMDLLLQFVSKHKEKIAVKELVDQIRHLEYKNEERIDHVAGKHDDAVFAYLACVYIMFFGKNLPRFGLFNRYNFDGDDIDERNKGEDKLGKILKQTRLRKLVQANPFLAGLFEDLLYKEDEDKAIQQEIWDFEATGDSNSIFQKEIGGMRSVVKANTFRNLNAVNMDRMNRNASGSSIFGVDKKHNGSNWW
jgi:hypothetical protein